MSAKYENYITGDDGTQAFYETTKWEGQSFTPSVSHYITSVKVKIKKYDSEAAPGTITLTLKATDVDGKPTSTALATGTTDGDTLTTAWEWREITLGDSVFLAASTKYAFYLESETDDSSHPVIWSYDSTSPSYTGGNRIYTEDEGVSWTVSTGQDFMFEEWGEGGITSPSVTTQAASSVTATTATGNGNVTNLGYPTATQHGHCWSTSPNPTTADSKTENGAPTATGAYTSSITGLTSDTLYYCRAYVTNSGGTFYGVNVTFTASAGVPILSSSYATEVMGTTAVGHGAIVSFGGSAVTQHGVCWAETENPTTADDKTTEGATAVLGWFQSQMTSLTPNTTYHYRPYATNSSGTGYGTDGTFTTLVAGVPIVTTQYMTDVQPTKATGHGTIESIGGAAVTQHGHCWHTSYNPTTANSKTTNGAGAVGAFFSAITGLTAGTDYYCRAYATNSYGTAYGNNTIILAVEPPVPPGPTPDAIPGEIAILDEYLVYKDKDGTPRAILGVEF